MSKEELTKKVHEAAEQLNTLIYELEAMDLRGDRGTTAYNEREVATLTRALCEQFLVSAKVDDYGGCPLCSS